MLSAPGVLNLEALIAGSRSQSDPPIIGTRQRWRFDLRKVTNGEVSGGGVGTNVLPSISRID